MVKGRSALGWRMYVLETVIFFGILHLFALFQLKKLFLTRIEEFIEQIGDLEMNFQAPSIEMSERAMEIQAQAQKTGAILDFFRSMMHPQISVSEVKARDESGKFV